jgi:hypothetical protein
MSLGAPAENRSDAGKPGVQKKGRRCSVTRGQVFRKREVRGFDCGVEQAFVDAVPRGIVTVGSNDPDGAKASLHYTSVDPPEARTPKRVPACDWTSPQRDIQTTDYECRSRRRSEAVFIFGEYYGYK